MSAPKVRKYGPVWEAHLRQLWPQTDISLEKISQELGVDRRVVIRAVRRLGIANLRSTFDNDSWKNYGPKYPKPDDLGVQLIYRERWVEFLTTHPEVTLKETKVAHHDAYLVYNHLRRDDKAWLQDHLPRFGITGRASKRLINWSERDALMARQVEESAVRLKSLETRPVRVTQARIGHDLHATGSLKQNLTRLPLTASALARSVETHEDFAVRRVQWAVRQFIDKGITPTRWGLIMAASVNLRPNLQSPRVQAALDDAMQMLYEKLGGE